MANNEENEKQESVESTDDAGFDYAKEGEDGVYGWDFHKGPLIAAGILTLLFYIFVFLWVD